LKEPGATGAGGNAEASSAIGRGFVHIFDEKDSLFFERRRRVLHRVRSGIARFLQRNVPHPDDRAVANGQVAGGSAEHTPARAARLTEKNTLCERSDAGHDVPAEGVSMSEISLEQAMELAQQHLDAGRLP
jgi:hypothetical protein